MVLGSNRFCFSAFANGQYAKIEYSYTYPGSSGYANLYTTAFNAINGELILRLVLGKKTTEETNNSLYTDIYLKKGTAFEVVKTGCSDFLPNYSLNYTIENGEVKKLSFNATDGSYSTQSFSTPIILPGRCCRWLTNTLILVATSWEDTNAEIYSVDFTNMNMVKVCDYVCDKPQIYYAILKDPTGFCNFGTNSTLTFGSKNSDTVYDIQKYTWEATQENKITSITMGSTTFSNVSDGDITADDVVKGKTGYGLNGKVYGNLEVGLTKAEYEEALATALLIKPDEKGTDIRDNEMTPEL